VFFSSSSSSVALFWLFSVSTFSVRPAFRARKLGNFRIYEIIYVHSKRVLTSASVKD